MKFLNFLFKRNSEFVNIPNECIVDSIIRDLDISNKLLWQVESEYGEFLSMRGRKYRLYASGNISFLRGNFEHRFTRTEQLRICEAAKPIQSYWAESYILAEKQKKLDEDLIIKKRVISKLKNEFPECFK